MQENLAILPVFRSLPLPSSFRPAQQIRAFINSCRHRGTKLLAGSGNCAAITCPYHSWVYAPNGALLSCAGMEKTFNFDMETM